MVTTANDPVSGQPELKATPARIELWKLNLLFWLSLMPFTTSWMAQNHFAALPVAVYGCDLLASGIAYILERAIIADSASRSWPRRSART